MLLNTRTRELRLSRTDLSDPELLIVYTPGWLSSGLYSKTTRCVLTLAHNAGFTIYDPQALDITDHVAEEVHLDAERQRFVYGTEDTV